jgi:tetratricopeptide (TPR) repeat protein
LREQAEKGLALEQQAREMGPITQKYELAGRLMSDSQFDQAEAVMSELPPHIRHNSIINNSLGEVYGRGGAWPAAIRCFTRSVTADPTNHVAYHYLAPLLIQAGELGSYRELCERALIQFGETADPTVAERIAKDCLIMPPPAVSLEKLGRMADTAVAAGPGHSSWPYFALVKGLADYRQGHFAGALEWLQKIPAEEAIPARTVAAYATRAMAECRLGQTNTASATLAGGIKLSQAKLTKPGRVDWNDVLIARFLLREAQALLPESQGSDAHSQ